MTENRGRNRAVPSDFQGEMPVKTKTAASAAAPYKVKAKPGKKVRFEFFAPSAVKVAVVGTFNHWSCEKDLMTNDGTGRWKIELVLPAGRYEYRYSVDGIWQNDQRPVECIPNAFGSWNCVVEVC